MSPKVSSPRTGRKKGLTTGYLVLIVLLVIAAIALAHLRLDLPVEKLAQEFTNEYSHFVEVDGVEVHYREEGAGEPLVLLHGWSASLHTWDGWAKELQEDFRVIRLDLPGFGLTGPVAGAEYSLEFYADFLNRFLSALEIEQCCMAGNSLGGGITWFFTAKYPEKVRKMILVDAAGYNFELPAITKLAQPKVVRYAIRHLTPRYAIGVLVRQVYGDTKKVTAATVDRYYRLLLREGNRVNLFDILDQASGPDDAAVTKLLKHVEIPALIMWGEQDGWIPLELGHRFAEELSEARLIIYEGAGHIPMEELPETTAADARNFLLE
ncbi:MAG: alpha/beta hydrolase [Firmicutes bacterium]|nr:alpha/beta hydrolase [Bacillota bacterium]